MVFEKINDINRNLCKDFCDLAHDKENYTMAWVLAIVLDIIVPIALFIIGISITLIGLIMSIVFPVMSGVLLGVTGIVILLIIIAAILLIAFIMFRELGFYGLIGIGVYSLILFLSIFPILNIAALVLSLVPWNIVAVLLYTIGHKGVKIGKEKII